jgi:type II secretory pathway component PulL
MPESVLVVGDLGDDGAELFAESLGLPALSLDDLADTVPGMSALPSDAVAANAVAIGLGLAVLDGKRRMNLRGGPYALAHAAQGIALRRLAGVGVGLLIILALATGNAWVRNQVAQSKLDEAKLALVAHYKMVFPGVGKVVNPVKQAKNELKKLKARALLYGTSGTTPLGYLDQVSQAIPRELKLDVFEFSIEGTRLRMEAQAISFDAIDQIKTQLAALPGIEQVRVSDAKMNAKENRVKFRVHATLTEGV